MIARSLRTKTSGLTVVVGAVGSILVSMLSWTPTAWRDSTKAKTWSSVGIRVPGTGSWEAMNGSVAGSGGLRVPQSSVSISAKVRSWMYLPT